MNSIHELNAIAEENVASNQEVCNSVEEITVAIDEIAESSKVTDQSSDALQESMNYFKGVVSR